MTGAFGSAGRRSLALVLALALLGSVFFGTMPVFATGGSVAKIGEKAYNTLDEAIDAAADGAVIELLADATTAGMNLNKALTIQAAENLDETPKVTFTEKGIALWGKALKFQNCDVKMIGVGATPYGEWNWMTICASENASLTLDNVRMNMDATGASNSPHAIYFCKNNVLNVENGSELTIKNYPQDALEWDGGNGGYNVNISDSIFISDHNRSGFTGTFIATFTNSKVDVINSTGNGSNGSHFIIDCSNVNFSNNGSHGLSAGTLTIRNRSVVTGNGNGMYGITYTGNMEVDGTSSLEVIQNALEKSGGGMRANNAGKTSKVAAGAIVKICDNGHNGLENYGNFTFENGAELTISGNNERTTNGGGIFNGSSGTLILPENAVVINNHAAQTGGGICNGGSVTIPESVQLYNNHSDKAGDDIYNRNGASITFGEVGSGWVLDDCSHVIDGWYDDSENTRWKAHATGDIDDNYIEEFAKFTDGIAEVNELKALKAAHGLILPAWDISKSKTATNLDENLESDVTLALPAAEYRQTMDVVFVIDDTHAGSGIFAKSVSNLLDELASKKNLDISVGVVAFDAVSRDWLSATSGGTRSGLVSIQEEGALEALKKAVETKLSYDSNGYRKKVGGTNTEWPVEMASQMLQNGSGEDKYLIMFSDLYGYIYRGDLTIDGVTYHDVPLSKRLGSWNQGSLSMGTKYSTFAAAYAHRNDAENQTPDGFFRDSSWESYWSIYYKDLDSAPENTIAGFYQVGSQSYSGFEKSLCLTYDRLTSAAQNARVILVNNSFPNGDATNAQNMIKEMLDALESGNSGVTAYRYTTGSADEALSGDAAGNIFDGILEQLIQLVDDGSYVADEIGSGMFDGTAYDFAFVSDASRLSLTVGGESLKATALSGQDLSGASAAWQFGDEEKPNQFTLYYYENGITYEGNSYGECLIWEIHVPVTKDAPVQLTYSVRLTDPQTDPKKYGEYDADGSEGYPGLYTNNSATLYPKNSYEESGQPEAFGKPTVSYKAGVSVIVPADVTIYVGGRSYDGVIEGENGIVTDDASGFPVPGFTVSAPSGVDAAAFDPTKAVLKYQNGSDVRTWNIIPYDGDESSPKPDHGIYRFEPTEGSNTPVRMQFTTADGTLVTEDKFDIDLNLDRDLKMEVYGEGIEAGYVYLEYEGEKYLIEAGAGTLKVRSTTGQEEYGDVKTEGEGTVSRGDSGVVVPEDTTYSINGTAVQVADPSGVKLLFDDIIDDYIDSGEPTNTQLLKDKTDEVLTEAIQSDAVALTGSGTRHYELKYLDLVDTNNGNVWVAASGDITVCWPLPAGTSSSTRFALLHFPGLHREMGTDDVADGIEDCDVEVKDITVTGTHITFAVSPSGFSPFVLVWETSGGSSSHDPDPTPGTPLEPVTSTPDSSEPSAPGSSSTPSDPGVSSRPAVSDGASEPSDSVSSGSVTDPDVPKTGDDSSLVLWVTLAGAALIGLTGMILIVRRKENEDLSD